MGQEGETFSGEAGEVTEDSHIILDSALLKKYEDDLVMAIIAHELAHFYLGHFCNIIYTLEDESNADALARKWGLDVDKFRRIAESLIFYETYRSQLVSTQPYD